MEDKPPKESSTRPKIRDRGLSLLPRRVLDLRNRRGWSQRELARRAGIHPTRLSKVERGSARMSLRELLLLGEALETSLDELVYGESRFWARPVQLLSELETVMSPQEILGLARLLQALLVGYEVLTVQDARRGKA